MYKTYMQKKQMYICLKKMSTYRKNVRSTLENYLSS